MLINTPKPDEKGVVSAEDGKQYVVDPAKVNYIINEVMD